MENSKNTGLSWGVLIFWERERSRDEVGMVGPAEVSQVPLCPIFDIKI
jgi:hypothetical protein